MFFDFSFIIPFTLCNALSCSSVFLTLTIACNLSLAASLLASTMLVSFFVLPLCYSSFFLWLMFILSLGFDSLFCTTHWWTLCFCFLIFHLVLVASFPVEICNFLLCVWFYWSLLSFCFLLRLMFIFVSLLPELVSALHNCHLAGYVLFLFIVFVPCYF